MKRRRWMWCLRRALALGFFSLVAWLLVRQAREVEWEEVWQAAQRYSVGTLALAAALSVLSYSAYCSFDVMGKHYTGHGLSTPAVVVTAFISYAFNLNFGSLVGGAGFRYRLYSRQGVETADISRVLGLSLLANWSGYLPLLGAVLLTGAVPVPERWPFGAVALRWTGVFAIALTAGYLLACSFSRRRRWSVRGHVVTLPSGALAATLLAGSMLCWSAIAGVIQVLMWRDVAYATLLGVLLMAAVAGAITHVPAGLGVLEAVFIALLGDRVPAAELLASLLAYRAVYYLVPLGLAAAALVFVEARTRSRGRAGGQDAATRAL